MIENIKKLKEIYADDELIALLIKETNCEPWAAEIIVRTVR